MSISYKPLVDRFCIPRPTLIEWQKKANEPENWRSKHLSYLRMQFDVEQETRYEIKQAAPCVEDLFLLVIYLYFTNQFTYLSKQTLMSGFRAFSLHIPMGVEYQHDFATRIWSLRMGEESSKKMVNYYRLFDLLKQLTSAQYALLLSDAIEFNLCVKKTFGLQSGVLLEGKTWQELFTYDKAFSQKSIEHFFKERQIL